MELLDMTNLSELSNIADPLALQRAEVLGDSAALEVDDTSEGLVEQRSDGSHREVTGFGLFAVRTIVGLYETHSFLQQGCGSWP